MAHSREWEERWEKRHRKRSKLVGAYATDQTAFLILIVGVVAVCAIVIFNLFTSDREDGVAAEVQPVPAEFSEEDGR